MKYILFIVLACNSFFGLAQANVIKVALVKDGPLTAYIPESVIKNEISELLGGEYTISYVANSRTTANWSVESIHKVFDGLYGDQSIDFIVTLGPIASHELTNRKTLSIPTIAAVVINPIIQNFPLKNKRSSRKNLSFVADLNDSGGEIEFFSKFVGKRKIAVLVEPFLAESWNELQLVLDSAAKEYGLSFKQISVGDDLEQIRRSIPSDTEAVIVGFLSQYNKTQIKRLADLLIELKLPSYTFMGERGVELGFMVTQGQVEQDRAKLSRRVALNIQRLLLGQSAEDLPVDINFSSQVIFNERTALMVNFAPNWQKILSAKVLFRDESNDKVLLSVEQALKRALKENLSLQSQAIDIELARQNVAISKSKLYPQLGLSVSYQQINEEQAIVGNPESRGDASLNLSQSLYSESLWANFEIKELQLEIEVENYKMASLEIADKAVQSYLQLLSAKANEMIQNANLELTTRNLALARNRMQVGSSGQSDVLRFKSQMARDRQTLFSATAARQQAEIILATTINLADGQLVDIERPQIGNLLNILTNTRFLNYVSNQIEWQTFQEFYKKEALRNSPELKQVAINEVISKRQLLSIERGNYMPDIALVAKKGDNFSQNGAGSLDDYHGESWRLGIEATLAFDLSGSQRKTSQVQKLKLKKIELNKRALRQQVETSTQQALFAIGSSYPSIQLSKESSKAAIDSLAIVQDSYAKGAVSISELLDAQNNALTARLSAAEAEYRFLSDYVSLLKAAGDFSPILNGQYNADWFERLNKYFKQKNIPVSIDYKTNAG